MVNPTPTSFYADGTTYDEAEVVTNDHQSSSQASAAPSSFFTDGGLVGAEDVTHNDVAPSDTSSPMPSSFFTDGGLVGAETVTNNDNVPNNSPRPAPTSFYPDGNLYDFLSQESEVVALLQQLAATTTTNANAAASSASNSATSATNAAASAAQAATAVQGAAGTATPLIDGTAAVGTSTKWAHEDHVHPKDPTLASVSYVDTKVAAVVNSAPATLDTLNELAAALGDDPNFATTVSTQIGTKADKTYVDAQGASITSAVALKADKTYVDTQDATKAPINSPALTGSPTAPTAAAGTSTVQIATTAFVANAVTPPSGTPLKIASTVDSTPRIVSVSANTFTATGTASVSITPQSSSNKLRVEASGIASCAGSATVQLTLFRSINGGAWTDLTPSGLTDLQATVVTSNVLVTPMHIDFTDVPNTTLPVQYQIYIKSNIANTMYLGRRGADPLVISPTFITLTEIKG
jgi:hypothetical protein